MIFPNWTLIAFAPALWMLGCEICYFWVKARDEGAGLAPKNSFERALPFFKIIVVTMIGGAIGYWVGSFFSDDAAVVAAGLGTVPGAFTADNTVSALRPNSSKWRILPASLVIIAIVATLTMMLVTK